MPNKLKVNIVEKLTEELKKTPHVFITDYQGMNAEEFNDLRIKLQGVGAKFKVVKNRLARVALKSVGWDLSILLKGASGLVYNGKDAAQISKVLNQYGKEHSNLKLKGGYLFGSMADSAMVKAIANLPSKEVLLATLLARLNSPLQTLACTLNEPLRALHSALGAVATKMQSQPAA